MPTPMRFTVVSYNVWANARWPEREPALRGFLRDIRPDILALQELRPTTQAVLDEVLQGYERVCDAFEGWNKEGNIYWRADLFEALGYGAEEIGMKEALRRLFWVRLKEQGSERTFVMSTAHFTWGGHRDEVQTGVNPRPGQAARAAEALAGVREPDEAVMFVGDFNEAGNVVRVLREAGFNDSFTCRGTSPRPTHPAVPTAKGTPKVLDWQFHSGPIRVMASEVVDYYRDDLAPSDHKAVLAVYELADEG